MLLGYRFPIVKFETDTVSITSMSLMMIPDDKQYTN